MFKTFLRRAKVNNRINPILIAAHLKKLRVQLSDLTFVASKNNLLIELSFMDNTLVNNAAAGFYGDNNNYYCIFINFISLFADDCWWAIIYTLNIRTSIIILR